MQTLLKTYLNGTSRKFELYGSCDDMVDSIICYGLFSASKLKTTIEIKGDGYWAVLNIISTSTQDFSKRDINSIREYCENNLLHSECCK
ncbi:hypothetical protein LHK94_20495 [Dickeya zeae]|uniref:hypothetical protein n=1 Tax=Dickeya zeae TaxID=204042 RepID=UPI001CFAE7AA|nr:hypothetical protein [Dickeya zeae]UCZ75335.1 hypothetical protein LHK94_20495 [Dickeya zeae]